MSGLDEARSGMTLATDARVDLHMHSTASDGTLPPSEVVRRARAAGLAGISLTDHDTVDGLEEAAHEAATQDLALLVGAELSANEPGRSVHLLAYGFDPADAGMLEFFRVYREDRIRRAREIVERLNRLEVPIAFEEVERHCGRAAPTRAHVARALVSGGHVSHEQAVFSRWLSRGRPAFVEKRPTPPAEVFERVHRAGGVVLLAHPGKVHGIPEVRRWAAEGLDGVEVLHPVNSPAVRERMNRTCAELGLLRSGGSDWHGPSTRRSELGSEQVPASWMTAIAARTSGDASALLVGGGNPEAY